MIRLDELADAQPVPVQRPGGVSMHDVAMALHGLRKAHGLGKYASLLQAANGRSSGIDRLQESLDGLVYDLQVVIEQAAMAEALAAVREWLVTWSTDQYWRDGVLPALEHFDALLSPDALALRADAIAGELIRQAVPGRAGADPARPAHEEGGT